MLVTSMGSYHIIVFLGCLRLVSCNVKRVVRVDPSKLREVYEIECECFDQPYPLSYIKTLMILANELFIVALNDDGRVVGYAVAVRREHNVCHLASIAVKKACWGKGIGRKLLNEIIHRCRNSGCNSIVLEVEYTNTRAQRLYRSLGFKPLTVIVDYYGPKRHAIVLVKTLIG